jgi:type I restriction enzyme, S subunit
MWSSTTPIPDGTKRIADNALMAMTLLMAESRPQDKDILHGGHSEPHQQEEPMSKDWPRVRLDQLVSHRKEFVTIDDLCTYKRLRVQLHAQGIVLRDQVTGALIKAKKQQICRSGELLVAEIDAKVGGFGIVPSELEGAIVSSHYFLFVVDKAKLDRRFLGWFIKTHAFQDQVAAQGTTNYAAIRPGDVLGYEIPLPPLTEQRRIVARIGKLAAKIAEARSLRKQATEEAEALCRAIIRNDPNSKQIRMGELLRLRMPDVTVQINEIYQFAGVYSFGRGVFRAQAKTGMEFAYPRLTRLRTGNFLYPKLMAWEGALGVVPPECDGCVVSTEFPVFEILEDKVLPEVLDTYFRTPEIWPEISGASTGTNVRRRRLNPQTFLNYRIPLPSRLTQERLRNVRAKVNALKHLQVVTAAKLDALVPAILDRAIKGGL